MRIGIHFSTEELTPQQILAAASQAEEAGFELLTISDHYHPWTHEQGQSPFVWSVLGAIAQVTERIEVGTAVTCPTVRIHPAVVAQAAATTAVMLEGRFFLGVGTGEALNEHILGDAWPAWEERAEMLVEACEVMRSLWSGEQLTHRGDHYDVDRAQLFTVPESPPPIVVSGFGPKAARLAGAIGDGYMNVQPDAKLREAFAGAGGRDKPCYGKLDVCIANSVAEARRTAHRTWPTTALQGELAQLLPLPTHFEQATASVTEEQVADAVICGADPQLHVEGIERYAEAGFDHVIVQQYGTNQDAFLRLYRDEVLPAVRGAASA